MRLITALALFGALSWGGPTAALAAPEIGWRVENPFRLFKDPKLTDLHRQVFESLSEEDRRNPVLASERRLVEIFPEGWANEFIGKTCWQPEANSYNGCGKTPYVEQVSHRVLAELGDLDRGGSSCSWRVEPIERKDKTTTPKIEAPCRARVRLDIPYPGGARVRALVDGEAAAATIVKVRDLFIVGIGDSFGSGEGNPDKPAQLAADRSYDYGKLGGYPARAGTWQKIGDKAFAASGAKWWSQACHRSLYAHQLRVALQLALEDPHRAITFASFACSGAETTFGLMVAYKGTEWAPDQPDRPQVTAAARTQCGVAPVVEEKYPDAFAVAGKLPELADIFIGTCPRADSRKIDLLMVSIGGNDVGFARLVANAVLDDASTLRSLGGWMGQVQEAAQILPLLEQLGLRYKALNRAIHANLHIPWSESDRVLLTAYPMLTLRDDGQSVCPDGQAGMEVFPGFKLSSAKAAAAEKASDRLYREMRTAAGKHGWTFVDAHRRSFAGHGICAGRDDVANGSPNDLRLPIRVAGVWQPFNPLAYQPYAPRARWFRTPNDAFLTGHFHMDGLVMRSMLGFKSTSWFQLLLASTYSGAFHPTAEGQAVIADAAVIEAREVLARYAPF